MKTILSSAGSVTRILTIARSGESGSGVQIIVDVSDGIDAQADGILNRDVAQLAVVRIQLESSVPVRDPEVEGSAAEGLH